MDAMHAIDAEDVEWVNVTGNHWRGKANVRRGHTNLFKIFKDEKVNLKVDQVLVRLIAPSVAIAVTTMRFSGDNEVIGLTIPRCGLADSLVALFEGSRRSPVATARAAGMGCEYSLAWCKSVASRGGRQPDGVT